MLKQKSIVLDFEIDKLTNSIENTVTGESYPTEVALVAKNDLAKIAKDKTWLFDWNAEYKMPNRKIYKLTTIFNPNVVQGLMSIEVNTDHIFMHLIESAKFNKGKHKMYFGVPGNLVAFACKTAFEKGFDGAVSFYAKTKLIEHYKTTLGAVLCGRQLMILPEHASQVLVRQYFNL